MQRIASLKNEPVLVAGGSLVGLSTALFLRANGVSTVLVEPHKGSHPHPRAVGYTPRTLELFREAGLGAQIPQAPASFRLRRVRVDSLAGTWFEESDWTPREERPLSDYSPCSGAAIAQDGIEPILRERARVLGADLRLGDALVSFEQNVGGVTARCRTESGEEYTLRAAYLIAADGSKSGVREALGIGRTGRGLMRVVRSVLFRADLEEYLAKGISQFEIDQPDLKAFLTTYRDGRWVLMFTDGRERTEQEMSAAIARAIGRSDVRVEIITTGRWELTALIADRFSAGRVFLAGDAAHTLPPTRGGFGANTGIQDAHNLAWKIAAVLGGQSRAALLDTYDAERRPVAWGRLRQTFARPDYAKEAAGIADGIPILDGAAMEFGELYRSTSILGADTALPVAARPDQWAGQPGTRIPHLWVNRQNERISTLDLVGRGWVLLAENTRWGAAVASTRSKLAVDVAMVRAGADFMTENPEALRTALGITSSGATLIRPDGYVAWRAVVMPDDPVDTLAGAVRASACASS